jgi:hypothetical protein
MKKQRKNRLVHFLRFDTRDPLCGGLGQEPSGAAVNGVAICAACARGMTEQVERARELPEPRLPAWW